MSDGIRLVQVAPHQQVVVNVLTTEAAKLPPGNDWQIVYDREDRNGMVFRAEDTSAAYYLHDLLKEEVFESSRNGELFIKTQGMPGWKRLITVMLERRELKVSIRLPLLAAKQVFMATVFRRKRPGGLLVFWPIPMLYHLFSMTSFSGWPSKWAQHSAPRWSQAFRKMFGYEAFIGSTHGNTSKDNLQKVQYSQRCLEQLSRCTSCFIWLLSRWAFASREQGGLTQPDARASVSQILQSLLDVLQDGGGEWLIPVKMSLKWACAWPVPEQQVALGLSGWGGASHEGQCPSQSSIEEGIT